MNALGLTALAVQISTAGLALASPTAVDDMAVGVLKCEYVTVSALGLHGVAAPCPVVDRWIAEFCAPFVIGNKTALVVAFQTSSRTGAIFQSVNSKIVTSERMSVLAMGGSSISRRFPEPSHDVLPARHGLQMGRVETCPISTQVIERQAHRYRTDQQNVRGPVSTHATFRIVGKQCPGCGVGVTVRLEMSGPNPTPLVVGGNVPRYLITEEIAIGSLRAHSPIYHLS